MLRAYFPNYYNNQWIAHTFKSILDEMGGWGYDNKRYVLSSERHLGRDVVRAFPSIGYKYCSKYFSPHWMREVLNKKFVDSFGVDDIAYFWTTSDLSLARSVKNRGRCFSAMEMINCSQLFRLNQLRKAYASIGLEPLSLPSDGEIKKEAEFSKEMDVIFCSNRFAMKSLYDYGVDEKKCRLVNFGWSPERLGSNNINPEREPGGNGLKFLFVGTFDVRKGAGLLLEAWADADVSGELIIAGVVDPLIKWKYENILSSKNVKLLGHVSDMGDVYRGADVFVFPTWEEGGPLVTIEAMSQGLPAIVTPVGTADIFDENSDAGQIVGFGSKEELIDAIRLYDSDRNLVMRHGVNARNMAERYTWKDVAKNRIDVLHEFFG